MFVHHDVAIVSVFDLQQVTDQRVGSHALDKVGPGLRAEGGGMCVATGTCNYKSLTVFWDPEGGRVLGTSPNPLVGSLTLCNSLGMKWLPVGME